MSGRLPGVRLMVGGLPKGGLRAVGFDREAVKGGQDEGVAGGVVGGVEAEVAVAVRAVGGGMGLGESEVVEEGEAEGGGGDAALRVSEASRVDGGGAGLGQ